MAVAMATLRDSALSEDGAHRGLDRLGIVQVRAVRRQVDCLYFEPVGQTQDGSCISRVADRVQHRPEAVPDAAVAGY